jgi:flavin reductase (DIM6/NTAB) family NADH-FMN oxidoreductase RutF
LSVIPPGIPFITRCWFRNVTICCGVSAEAAGARSSATSATRILSRITADLKALPALASIPMPVAVVSAGDRSAVVTLTYVSLDPPLLAVPLRSGSRIRAAVEELGAFRVSVLAEAEGENVAVYDCRLEDAAGPLLLGRVERAETFDREPAVRFRRRYRALGDALDLPEDEGYPL